MFTSSSRARRGVVVAAVTAGLVGFGGQAVLASPTGVDIAGYQHPNGRAIDWASVEASGERFAIVKATEGRTFTNTYFRDDFADARAAGLVRGAYHYARPDTSAGDAANEARRFVTVAGTLKGRNTLPGVLDLETDGGLSDSALIRWTQTWLSTVESYMGRKPIIYTGPSFWETEMGNSAGFSAYPLWIAHYTSASSPRIPGGWSRYTMWQYTSQARVPGISGDVDRNRFHGTGPELAALSNGVRTSLSLSAASTGPTTVSGALTSSSGTGVAAEPLAVYQRPAGTSTWTLLTRLTSASDGSYSWRVDPRVDTEYQVRYPGDTLRLGSTSATVTVGPFQPVVTRLTFGADSSTVTYGGSTSVRGRLTEQGGAGVAGRTVGVYRKRAGATSWSLAGRVTTAADGRFARTVQPPVNTTFTAVFDGDAGHRAANAAEKLVGVAPAVSARVSDATPARGTEPTLSGQVSPAHAGQTVYRQRLVDGTWRTWASTVLSSTGRYRFTLTPRRVTTYQHRVVKSADADHLRGVSATVLVRTH